MKVLSHGVTKMKPSEKPLVADNNEFPNLELTIVPKTESLLFGKIKLKDFREAFRFAKRVGGLSPQKIKDFSLLVCRPEFLDGLNRMLASVSDEQLETDRKLIFSQDCEEIRDLISYMKAFPSEKQEVIFDDNLVIKMLILIKRFFVDDKVQYLMMKEYFIYILPVSYHPK